MGKNRAKYIHTHTHTLRVQQIHSCSQESKQKKNQKKKNNSHTNRVALRFCYVVERATCKTQLSPARSAPQEIAAEMETERLAREREQREKSGKSKKKKKQVHNCNKYCCDLFTCSPRSLARFALPAARKPNDLATVCRTRQQVIDSRI